jgi:broad specificity phosphatase PhoE
MEISKLPLHKRIGYGIKRVFSVPKWPASIVIVRHGESEQNLVLDLEDAGEERAKLRGIRNADIKLTDEGERQAAQTGAFLAKMPRFDVIFYSPYARARATAEKIRDALGYDVKLVEDHRLREKDMGALYGLSKSEIRKNHPDQFERRKRDGKMYWRPPEGENWFDVGDRLHSLLDKFHREYAGKHVLVVTHEVPYKMFRQLFEHLDEKKLLSFGDVPNCGILSYTLDRNWIDQRGQIGRLLLKDANRVAHKRD